MAKPELTVASRTPVHEVAANHAARVVEARTQFESLSGVEKFIAEQAAHFGFANQDIKSLHQAIQSHPDLAGLEENELRAIILNAFQQKSSPKEMGGVAYLPSAYREFKPQAMVEIDDILAAKPHVQELRVVQEPRPEMKQRLQERMKKSIAAEEAAAAQGASSARGASGGRANTAGSFTSRLAEASTEQKVNSGIWMAAAGLSVLGAFSAAKHSVTADENGDQHIQWTNAGVALLQATLATACAYMGARALGGGAAR